MRRLFFLWSALLRIAQQGMSAWRAVIVIIMLCLMVVNGCDVRPFSTIAGKETNSDEDGTDEDDEDDEDDGTDEDNTTGSLMLNADPEEIDIAENTSERVQVTLENPDPERTYAFEVPRTTTNGTVTIDDEADESITFTYTPNDDFSGTDSIVVTVTDDGVPAQMGDITIDVTVSSQ